MTQRPLVGSGDVLGGVRQDTRRQQSLLLNQ